MDIYMPINDAVENLISALEDLKPGLITSRMVLQISTEDKNMIAWLKTLDVEDQFNGIKIPGTKPVARKPRSLKKKVAADLESDGTML